MSYFSLLKNPTSEREGDLPGYPISRVVPSSVLRHDLQGFALIMEGNQLILS
jgi:hypothetical protein